jgi:hypothetical protein
MDFLFSDVSITAFEPCTCVPWTKTEASGFKLKSLSFGEYFVKRFYFCAKYSLASLLSEIAPISLDYWDLWLDKASLCEVSADDSFKNMLEENLNLIPVIDVCWSKYWSSMDVLLRFIEK